ncbi:MAG: KH domain-containing protein [Candidatus Hadarchaeales archaeon]
MEQRIKLPKERIGVAIGQGGKVKTEIERRTGTEITFDSETGEITIKSVGEDPLGALRARDVLNAIARGFSSERAFNLFDENKYLEVIDITDISGRSEKALVRLKGRVIGEGGRTRRIIEETTGACVSVFGKTVALIGDPEQLAVAREAVMMLLRGAPHSAVYKFLERKRREAKRREREIWRR